MKSKVETKSITTKQTIKNYQEDSASTSMINGLYTKALFGIKENQQCSSTNNAAVKSKTQFEQTSNIDSSSLHSFQVKLKLTLYIFKALNLIKNRVFFYYTFNIQIRLEAIYKSLINKCKLKKRIKLNLKYFSL